MEFTILTNLIQEIQQMQVAFTENSESSCAITLQTLECLLDLQKIIQQKFKDQDDIVTDNLEKKLNEIQKEVEKNYHNLRKTQESHEEKLKFKDEIILRNCALIIQKQWKHYKLMEKEKIIFEQETASNEQILKNQTRKINDEIIAPLKRELEQNRISNMLEEKKEREEWNKMKEKLSDVLSEYDVRMLNQQEELESIEETIQKEEIKLMHFKTACAAQTEVYNTLMAKKQEYLEQQRRNKLAEIRKKIARRTIAKFIEKHYAAWKKKKLRVAKKKVKHKYNLNMSMSKIK